MQAIRLVTMFGRNTDDVRHLVTRLEFEASAEIVRPHKHRMSTEAMFRGLKNRSWNLGIAHVRLSEAPRHDRHFGIAALAHVLLCAFGTAAETLEIAQELKANTHTERFLNLARIGNYFAQRYHGSLEVRPERPVSAHRHDTSSGPLKEGRL